MLPYTKHHVTPSDEAAVLQVLRSDRLTQGPWTQQLEAKMCETVGTKYCVAVSSGTAALHLAYVATGAQWIWTTPMTFVATANAALMIDGCSVDFVDCDRETGLVLDWDKGGRQCVPVHLGGQGANMQGNMLIEDATHALGAGFAIGKNSKAACFSFHPAKHVAAGEGGAICTNDQSIWARCISLRDHGRGPLNDVAMACWDLGYNYRLDEMSAALACSQLERLNWNVNRRREIATQYDEAFRGKVRTVPHRPGSARHLYQLLIEQRNARRVALAERGIGTQMHYHPVHLQPYYRATFEYGPGDFPNAEWHGEHTLSIPLFPTLTEAEQETVIRAVLEVCHG